MAASLIARVIAAPARTFFWVGAGRDALASDQKENEPPASPPPMIIA